MTFPTEQQVFHRLRWDPRFDVRRCQVVISLRPSGTKRMPLLELDTEVVPWHRIVEFWIDDELAWSRPARIDRLAELAARAPVTAERALEVIPSVVQGGGKVTHPASLRVVTWNLLFDRHAPERLRSEERWLDALGRIAATGADLIALVEVTPAMWKLILAQPWVRLYVASHAPDGRLLEPYGQVLLSRHPIREAGIVRLVRDRRALVAKVLVGTTELGVAVVHLTSNRKEGAPALRAGQLADLLGHVRATPCDAWLVTGDFNADEHELADQLAGTVDVWNALHPGEPGHTFDVDANPLAAAGSVRGLSARYDRTLVIDGAVALRPTRVELIGRELGPCGLPPSDHFAVVADLALAARDRPASHRTALVLLPPASTWGPIQRIRCAHDRNFWRWPPHVTLLYPFVDEADLPRAARIARRAVADLAPFELAFERVEPIDKRGRTMVVSPAPSRALDELYARLAEAFPALAPARAFRAHMTIARETRDVPATLPIRWTVRSIALLHRPSDRFHLIDKVALLPNNPESSEYPEYSEDRSNPSRTLDETALRTGAFSSRSRDGLKFSSGYSEDSGNSGLVWEGHRARAVQPDRSASFAAALATLRELGRAEPFGSALYALDTARDLDVLVDAPPPGFEPAGIDRYRGELAGITVDAVVARGDDPRWRSGPADAAALVEHLAWHGRYDAFLAAWPGVRRFVDARELSGNALGWLPTFGWAMLLAVPLCHDAELCAVDDALPAWFRWLAALRPGTRLGFDAHGADAAPLRITAPAAPPRDVARALTAGTARHLFAEFARASLRPLADDPPPGERIAITGPAAELGAYRGAFRSLLDVLDARPWAIRTGATWEHPLTVTSAHSAVAIVTAWIERSGMALQVQPR